MASCTHDKYDWPFLLGGRMTTNQVLQLDCREEENKKVIQKVLKLIKPLSKYSDEDEIPFWAIEKSITVMSKKYNMRVREFTPDVWANKNETIWKATIVNETNLTTTQVYGITLYEAFAKVAIQMYSMVRKGIATR